MALERRDRSRKQNKGPETEPSICVSVQCTSATSKQQEKDDVSNSGAEKIVNNYWSKNCGAFSHKSH